MQGAKEADIFAVTLIVKSWFKSLPKTCRRLLHEQRLLKTSEARRVELISLSSTIHHPVFHPSTLTTEGNTIGANLKSRCVCF